MLMNDKLNADTFFEIYMQAAREILGADELAGLPAGGDQTSDAAGFHNRFMSLSDAMGRRYGEVPADGIILRTGRAFMRLLIHRYPQQSGLFENDFRTLPKPERLFTGLGLVNELFWARAGMPAKLENADGFWHWNLQATPGLDARQMAWLGNLANGMLQEFMMWSTGGKYYPVHAAPTAEGYQLEIEKKYIS